MKKYILVLISLSFNFIVIAQGKYFKSEADNFTTTLNCLPRFTENQNKNIYSCNSDESRAVFSIVVSRLPVSTNLDEHSIKIFLQAIKAKANSSNLSANYGKYKLYQTVEYFTYGSDYNSWTKSVTFVRGKKNYTLNCTAGSKMEVESLMNYFENNFSFFN